MINLGSQCLPWHNHLKEKPCKETSGPLRQNGNVPLVFGAEAEHGGHPDAKGCKILQEKPPLPRVIPGCWGCFGANIMTDGALFLLRALRSLPLALNRSCCRMQLGHRGLDSPAPPSPPRAAVGTPGASQLGNSSHLRGEPDVTRFFSLISRAAVWMHFKPLTAFSNQRCCLGFWGDFFFFPGSPFSRSQPVSVAAD